MLLDARSNDSLVLCQHSSMRHGVAVVYFHDHLMTARIEGREGWREKGRGSYFVYFFML